MTCWYSGNHYDIGSASTALIEKGLPFLEQHLTESSTLVDLGCWTGRHIPLLQTIARGRQVIGIDIDCATNLMTKLSHQYPYAVFQPSGLIDTQLVSHSVDGVFVGVSFTT